jgi:hypothetical protein
MDDKRGDTMTYIKPEIAVLGDATDVICGKLTGYEPLPNQLKPNIVADSELDD